MLQVATTTAPVPAMLAPTAAPATACQRTLLGSVSCEGVGLHSGQQVRLKLLPAPADHGIVFIRTDLQNGARTLQARYDMVRESRLCTVLTNDHGASVSTVEHLLAALAGYRIDNAIIEIDGPEVPIMDGSAAPFMFMIDTAGIATQTAPRRWLQIRETVRVSDGNKWATLAPAAGSHFSVALDYAGTLIGQQSFAAELSSASFKTQIGRARTFGFAHEVEALRAAGLIKGGALTNALVVDGDRVLNPEGLRLPHEFARHKVLDAIGDLALAGGPILGSFTAHATGHALNNRLLRQLFATPSAFAWVTQAAQPSEQASADAAH